MLNSIEISNFFSFHHEEVKLKGLNALVGINGSGKTNFLKAVYILKAVVTEGGLQDLIINMWGGFDAVFYAGQLDPEEKPVVKLKFEFDQSIISKYGYLFTEPVIYQIRLSKVASTQNFSVCETLKTRSGYTYFRMNRGKGFAMEGASNDQHKVEYQLSDEGDSIFNQLVDKDRYVQIFAIREVMPTTAIRLRHDGANLPQLLNKIKINNKSDYNAIKQALNDVNPNYTGIDFNILGANIELMLEEDSLNRSIHVTHISDGTLRYLCLLAIVFNAQRGELVCIDEPEIGLHPDMVAEIVEGIKSKSFDSQFVVATHSEHVLNQLRVGDVLVFEKDEYNATLVQSFCEDDYEEWAASYATGRLWRNGDLGGNRY